MKYRLHLSSDFRVKSCEQNRRDDVCTGIARKEEKKKKPQREMTQLYASEKRAHISPTIAERNRRNRKWILSLRYAARA